MDLVLHIGRHKTGTTAIQRRLARRSPPGVHYPEAGRMRVGDVLRSAHHLLPSLLKRRPPTSDHELHLLAEAIRSESPRASVVVPSSEFLDDLSDADVSRAQRFVEVVAPRRVVVVYYAREQLEYLVSRFQQEVRYGSSTHDFREFLTQHPEPDLPQLIRRWEAIGEVHVRLYDRRRFPDGDVVRDLLSLVGMDPGPDQVREEANLSVSGNLLAVKAALNALGEEPLPSQVMLRRIAATEPRFQGRFRIPPGIAGSVRSQSRYNAVLHGLYPDLDFAPLWDAPPIPDTQHWTADLSRLRRELELSATQIDYLASASTLLRRWFLSDEP